MPTLTPSWWMTAVGTAPQRCSPSRARVMLARSHGKSDSRTHAARFSRPKSRSWLPTHAARVPMRFRAGIICLPLKKVLAMDGFSASPPKSTSGDSDDRDATTERKRAAPPTGSREPLSRLYTSL